MTSGVFAQLVAVRLRTLLRNRQPLVFMLVLPTFLLFFMTAVWGRYDPGYVAFLLPGLISMVVLSNSLYSIGGDVVVLRHSGLIRRYKLTPVSGLTYVASLIASNLILVALQTWLMLQIVIHIFGFEPRNQLQFWITFMAGTLCFMSLGSVVATLAATPQTVTSLITMTYLPVLFLSGAFFPVHNGPAPVAFVAKLLPFTYWLDAMRNSLIRGTDFAENAPNYLILMIWFVAFLLMGAWRFRWE